MKYLYCLVLVLLAGCSSTEEKPEVKRYSEDTNRAFEMIERGGSYYLKKAPTTNTPPPQIKAPVQQVQPRPVFPAPERRRVVETLKPGAQTGVQEEIIVDEKINTIETYDPKKPQPKTNSKSFLEEVEKTPAQNTRPNSKTDERLVEINQNLAFYCMKHRKDPAFGGDEERCMKFVNKTMNDCQKSHRIVNSKLLQCIQKKLKSRQ